MTLGNWISLGALLISLLATVCSYAKVYKNMINKDDLSHELGPINAQLKDLKSNLSMATHEVGILREKVAVLEYRIGEK